MLGSNKNASGRINGKYFFLFQSWERLAAQQSLCQHEKARMNRVRKESVVVACSQLPAAAARSNGVAAYPTPLHLNHHHANANNNCNAHNVSCW